MVPYQLPKKETWNGLAFVGEAPGAEEVKLGRPFVGRSGKLLDDLLEKTGISRENSLILNVFRIQPPKNKVNHFFISKKGALQDGSRIVEELGKFGSLWCKDEFSVEINALSYVLHKWHPKIIVALGRTPFWALTGENELLKKVGGHFPCRFCPEIPVFPTFHPSFILRGNWKLMDEWQNHLCAVRQQVEEKVKKA
jgi:uracil-DNA glycosylase